MATINDLSQRERYIIAKLLTMGLNAFPDEWNKEYLEALRCVEKFYPIIIESEEVSNERH